MSQPNIYDEFWSICGAILVWAVTSLSIFYTGEANLLHKECIMNDSRTKKSLLGSSWYVLLRLWELSVKE